MTPVVVLQKIAFRLRQQVNVRQWLRRAWWQAQGARFGAGTSLGRVTMNWPHQVAIGEECILEDDLFFKFAGVWEPGPTTVLGDRVFVGRGCEFNISHRLRVGDDCLIASGCKFVDGSHGTAVGPVPMNRQPCAKAPIVLEEDVWLGVNVVVLKGVTIGRGAIVGAGAVVTKSIPAYEVWAGVPARKIGDRAHRRGLVLS